MQSSQALFERQRNPGVGYFGALGARSNGSTPEAAPRHSTESSSSHASNAVIGSSNEDEEAVSLEYIRNIILQFLENKEMRVSSFTHFKRAILQRGLHTSLILSVCYQ